MSQYHPLFPVNLVCQWQAPSHFQLPKHSREHLPEHLLDWLLESDSLTAKLKRYCETFHVEVLGQKIEPCSELESNSAIAAGEKVLVREVLLYCDNKPQVFARSLLPLSTLTDEDKNLAELGTKPLGHVLFNDPSLERKNLEISSFDQSSTVARLVRKLAFAATIDHKMWGRRSLYYIHNKPLMVAEVFLPGAFAYQSDLSIGLND